MPLGGSKPSGYMDAIDAISLISLIDHHQIVDR